MAFIFTCEHGGNRIPARFEYLFRGQEKILNSHRAWDPGALDLARASVRDCPAPLYYSDISRLLVDLNRSRHHRGIFSEYTRDMEDPMKEEVLDEYYYPYREQVEKAIRVQKKQPVIHISFHSYVAELNGVVRKGDIGLLYDPARKREKQFSLGLQTALKQSFPGLVIRKNYPYLGIADGFTRYLRCRFPGNTYLGVEVEINQKHVISGNSVWQGLLEAFGGLLRGLEKQA